MSSSPSDTAPAAAPTRRRRARWLPWLVLLLAVAVAGYPLAATAYHDRFSRGEISRYESTPLTVEEKETLQADIDAYNRSVSGAATTSDPFAEGAANHGRSTFSAAGEVIAVLRIPTLQSELPVYYGTADLMLAKGVGMLENTPYPGLMGGNSVLTAHRGTHKAELFRHLDRLRPGDPIFFTDKLETKKYQVVSTEIVLPNQVERIAPEPGRDMVTLLTCDPYLVNSHRMLVHAERVPFTPTEAPPPIEPPAGVILPDPVVSALVLAAVVGLMILVAWARRRRRGRRARMAATRQ